MTNRVFAVFSRSCLPLVAAGFLAFAAGCGGGGGGGGSVTVAPPANNGNNNNNGGNTTVTGARVSGTVDTGGTVARAASSVQDVAGLTATLYTVGSGGALTRVNDVAAVPVTVDPANPSQGSFTFTNVPETVINGVVQLKHNTSGATLEAILPAVDKDETNALAVGVKSNVEASVLKEVVRQGLLTPEKVDPAILKETITSDMIAQGINPADLAQGVKAASEEVFGQFKAELGNVSDAQVVAQIKDIRRHQVDTIRIREELAAAPDDKKAALQTQLAAAQTKFEDELEVRLPPKAGEGKLPIEKFNEFQQAANAQLAAGVTNAELKNEIESRHEVSDVVHHLLAKARFLFPDGSDATAPVSPVEVIARVTGLDASSVRASFKTLVEDAQAQMEDPLANPEDVVREVIARAKTIRDQILTHDNLVDLADVQTAGDALATLEDEIQQKFAQGLDPKTVEEQGRARMKEILATLDAKLVTRLADLPETSRNAVREAVRQVLVTLSTGRVPAGVVRDPNAPLPPVTAVAPPPDADNDGVPDFIEIKEGSDPNSGDSKPVVDVVAKPDDKVDNDGDGKTDEEKGFFNGLDDDGDGKVDEDVSSEIPLTTLSGTVSSGGAPLAAVQLVLAFTPPGPDMHVAYFADGLTDATGAFSFTNVKAGRYFLAGYLEVDNMAGLGQGDKLGFFGTTNGPEPLEVGPDGLKLNITDKWIVATPGDRGRLVGKVTGPDGKAVSGKLTACRLAYVAVGFPTTSDAPQLCTAPVAVTDGVVSASVETGEWLVKVYFAITNDECVVEGKVTVVKDATSDVIFGAPICRGTISPDQAGSLEGVIEPLIQTVTSAPVDIPVTNPDGSTSFAPPPTPRVGLFLTPPGPGAPLFLAADNMVDAKGYFKFSKVPLNHALYLAVWFESGGEFGPQPGESMAVLYDVAGGRPKVLTLTTPATSLGNITRDMLKGISAPKPVKGVVKSVATGKGVAAQVSACNRLTMDPALPTLSTDAITTNATTNTTSGGGTSPGGATGAAPCFAIKTDLSGAFVLDIPPGVYELYAKNEEGGFTLPHELAIYEDKIKLAPITPSVTVVPTLKFEITSGDPDIPVVVVN